MPRTAQILGTVAAAIMSVSVVVGWRASSTASLGQDTLSLELGSFFVLILCQVTVTAVQRPRQRRALLSLVAALVAWSIGSSSINVGGHYSATHFPAPGEWFFLACYVGMAGFLLLDVPRGRRRALSTWLEAAVLCGGAACVAGGLLLTPFALRFDSDGLALAIAFLYPVADVLLGLLVVSQMALGTRPAGLRSLGLVLGFTSLALADSGLVLHLRSGTYAFSPVLYMLWGLGLLFIACSACLPRSEPGTYGNRPQRGRILLAAAAMALLVLVLRPPGVLGSYMAAPAVLTLVAAGGRLVLALREAREAAEAYRLSRTDDLTGLPNRRAVLADLEEAMRLDQPLALMLLDLDGFKDINDTLGHAAGDAVLVTVAHRMLERLPADYTVARLGGDEFALIVPLDSPIELVAAARRVLDILRVPASVDGLELAVNVSIGLSVRAEDDASSSDLLRRADVAMYQAKVTRAGALLYDPMRDNFSRKKLQLAEELRRAITRGELVAWYQPQVDARTGRVCGMEALVRWLHPDQGLLLPVTFLPAARRAGLMLALSEEVVRLVLADVRRWRSRGLEFRMAMNFAPPELLSGILLPRLFDAVGASGLPRESVVIEVTEDSFISDPERARLVLQEIRAHGLQIAIDDYGTGFSSLSYLRDLPVNEIKIDRSFVGAMLADRKSHMIVESTVQMAHALDLRLVAEGVEDGDTARELSHIGVDVLQGYHLARPMPARDVEGWVRRHHLQVDPSGATTGSAGSVITRSGRST
jgi:diguanylate cyclase (GGDEF)-like protein